jgi:hypothetical protein
VAYRPSVPVVWQKTCMHGGSEKQNKNRLILLNDKIYGTVLIVQEMFACFCALITFKDKEKQ